MPDIAAPKDIGEAPDRSGGTRRAELEVDIFRVGRDGLAGAVIG